MTTTQITLRMMGPTCVVGNMFAYAGLHDEERVLLGIVDRSKANHDERRPAGT